jgi:hypothetical protein
VRIYLDEDSASALLTALLRRAGHDVQGPGDVGLLGQEDAVQLTRAIRDDRICLTHNAEHFDQLHELILVAGGHHPGILTVRKDNDPKRDLQAKDIVRAVGKLVASGVPIRDNLHLLNHWR